MSLRDGKIPYEDCDCDEGKVWNNADPTSGQWVQCDLCDHPEVSICYSKYSEDVN